MDLNVYLNSLLLHIYGIVKKITFYALPHLLNEIIFNQLNIGCYIDRKTVCDNNFLIRQEAARN